MNKNLKIIITTGVYPPQIGGPAEYAKNLKIQFENLGHRVSVKTFGIERKLPSGFRHFFFFLKSFFGILRSDLVIAMDTFSVALPTVVVTRFFGKKLIIRIGGDFLWEQYVERTKKEVLLRDFYKNEIKSLSFKENIIFRLTRWTLKNATSLVFSTEWQKLIFVGAYGLDSKKINTIENFYGPKESDLPYEAKYLVASTREIFLKNKINLKKVFSDFSELSLFDEKLNHPKLMERIAKSYGVINVSFSEVSPNLILEAIRYNRPFICTREVGIFDRIKDLGLFVDPFDLVSIKKAVLALNDQGQYDRLKENIRKFNFTHSWSQIAKEFIFIYKKL